MPNLHTLALSIADNSDFRAQELLITALECCRHLEVLKLSVLQLHWFELSHWKRLRTEDEWTLGPSPNYHFRTLLEDFGRLKLLQLDHTTFYDDDDAKYFAEFIASAGMQSLQHILLGSPIVAMGVHGTSSWTPSAPQHVWKPSVTQRTAQV